MRRKKYTIDLHPAIHMAFKLLCDKAGYKRLNEAVELLMLKCIEKGSLELPPLTDRMARLEMRIKRVQGIDKIRKALGWKEK